MEKFTPTHKITADGEVILVQEFDGEDGKILMTAEEFESESLSDWTLNAQHELEFQGSTIYPYTEVFLENLLNHDMTTCKVCGYRWQPRARKPKQCPSCRSSYWDKLRTRRKRSESLKSQHHNLQSLRQNNRHTGRESWLLPGTRGRQH